MKRILVSFLFCFITLTAIAGGGNVKSTILQGKVINDEGEPVVGAKVELINSDAEVYTDFDGAFVFNDVAIKEQSVKVSFLTYEDSVTKLDLKELNAAEIQLQIQSK